MNCYLVCQTIVLIVLMICKVPETCFRHGRGFQSSGWYQVRMSPVRSLELSQTTQRRIWGGFPQRIITFHPVLGTTGDPKNGVHLETFHSPSLPRLGCLWQLFSKLLTVVHIATPPTFWYAKSYLSSQISVPQPQIESIWNEFCMGNYLHTFACPLQLLLASFSGVFCHCCQCSTHVVKKEQQLFLR